METRDLEVRCEDAGGIIADQQKRLSRAMNYIKANFAKHPRLEEIAAEARLSPFHFHRLFRKCYGRTFKQVLTSLQVEYAQKLLLAGVPTREVGNRSGFANQSHFTSRFKSVTGITPAAWRRQQRSAPSPSQAQNVR
jgi:AraC family transcriptional regulator